MNWRQYYTDRTEHKMALLVAIILALGGAVIVGLVGVGFGRVYGHWFTFILSVGAGMIATMAILLIPYLFLSETRG